MGGTGDLVVSLVGTMTYSYYKWINISCLCTYLMLWPTYRAETCSCSPSVLLDEI